MKSEFSHRARRHAARHRWVPVSLLVLGCALTVTASWYVAATQNAAMEAKFNTDAQQTRTQIDALLNTHFDVVRAGAALLSASNEINFAEFRAFVAGLHLRERYQGMRSLGFAESVDEAELATFEQALSLDGMRGFQVWPRGKPGRYHPVLFMEPQDAENRLAVGFDASTDPVVRDAMDRARDSGEPTVSGKLGRLRPFGGRNPGFALVLPIYRVQATPQTVDDRRRALLGFVFSVFNSDELFRKGVASGAAGLAVDVYDGAAADISTRLSASTPPSHANGYRSADIARVADRAWLTVVRSVAPRSTAVADGGVLLVGVLLSLLLYGVTQAQVRELDTAARHEAALRTLAQHDALTALPNRTLLNEHLGRAIAAARRNGNRVAVLFLDLDRFKHVNDSLGHAVGDELLLSVASRLRTCVRESDTVSRLGGDEFVLLLSAVDHADQAAARTQRMITALSAPHEVTGHTIHATVSVGISLFPDDGPDAAALLQAADTAMYQAKEGGPNTYQFFEPEMNTRVVARQQTEMGLHRAIERDEFVLHYQPKIALQSGSLAGAEALVRWASPDRGLVEPTEFVRIAEECGLIVPIGRQVLRRACLQARAWIDAGTPTAVAVNVSALEFRDKGFLSHLRDVLAETGVAPHFLELELTESSLMHGAESSIVLLQALKDLGVTIALDDFGTGYSSLSYLRHLPIDVLKIDQSFVKEITGAPGGSPIVSAIISMGAGLRCRVVAEGVETPEQAAFLRAAGCGQAQGFYFGRPVPADQFDRLRLENHSAVG